MLISNSSIFQIKKNILLADYVSWKSGGLAKQIFIPASVENLCEFLSTLDVKEEILWIGLGSNLLIRDGGFHGTVIVTKKYLRSLLFVDANQVYAECGVACPKLARFLAKNNLAGGEWFSGVPGTIGGALAMNAGAFGGEIWNHVVEVKCIDRKGNLFVRKPTDFEISYRTVMSSREEWFVSVTFQFEPGDKKRSLEKINELLDQRTVTQPTGVPSCGSVFRNPSGDYAARLVEATGLKGYRIGDAMVSEKHANFIINVGHASATDIEALVDYVAARVFDKQGIKLEREVKIVGEP